MRYAASICQLAQVIVLPRGARYAAIAQTIEGVPRGATIRWGHRRSAVTAPVSRRDDLDQDDLRAQAAADLHDEDRTARHRRNRDRDLLARRHRVRGRGARTGGTDLDAGIVRAHVDLERATLGRHSWSADAA